MSSSERACYRLELAYRGTRFSGWQRQNNAVTVQEVLESGLAQLIGQPITVIGAGRTDAGVHARGQVVSFELATGLPCKALVFGTNRHLPPDVRVLRAERIESGFDARRCAQSKHYLYRLSLTPVIPPQDGQFVAALDRRAEPAAMSDAMRCLEGSHDFSAFAKSGGAHRHPVRELFRAGLEQSGDSVALHFVGNGFLRGMVRALVGTLIDVGCGRLSRKDFERLLEGGSRSEAGPNAPARGLSLESVRYPDRWAALEQYPVPE